MQHEIDHEKKLNYLIGDKDKFKKRKKYVFLKISYLGHLNSIF